MANIRFALRTLFKTPFVTIFAIISIALGIGANTAMFSIFEHILMRPLPVQEPDRLVNLAAPRPLIKSIFSSHEGGWAGEANDSFSYPMFLDLEKIQTVFTGIAAHSDFRANIAAQDKVLAGSGFSAGSVRDAGGCTWWRRNGATSRTVGRRSRGRRLRSGHGLSRCGYPGPRGRIR